MIRILDASRVAANRDAVISYAGLDLSSETSERCQFVAAINYLLGTSISVSADDVVLEFDNETLSHELVRAGVLDKNIVGSGAHLIPRKHRRAVEERLRVGLATLESNSPELAEVMRSFIGEVFCVADRPHIGGGTVSSHIGVIWMAPNPGWTPHEIAVTFAHETAHSCIFLEDMVEGIFPRPDLLRSPDAQVTSAILRIRRPLDRAFHSACVSVAMAYYCTCLGRDDLAARYLPSFRSTVDELCTKSRYFSLNGLEILAELDEFGRNPDFGAIADSLGSHVAI